MKKKKKKRTQKYTYWLRDWFTPDQGFWLAPSPFKLVAVHEKVDKVQINCKPANISQLTSCYTKPPRMKKKKNHAFPNNWFVNWWKHIK